MASKEDPRPRAGSGHERFEAVMEPTGRFAVFEKETGLPAEIEAWPLIGLERDEAAALCRFLNARMAAAFDPAAPAPPRVTR